MRIGIIGTGVAGSLLAELLAGTPGIDVDAFDRVTAGRAGRGRHRASMSAPTR